MNVNCEGIGFAFCQDQVLPAWQVNIAGRKLKPGWAFGTSTGLEKLTPNTMSIELVVSSVKLKQIVELGG